MSDLAHDLGQSRYQRTNPDTEHIKLHCDTALKNIAGKVLPVQLSRNTLQDRYLQGYHEGFLNAYRTSGRIVHQQ